MTGSLDTMDASGGWQALCPLELLETQQQRRVFLSSSTLTLGEAGAFPVDLEIEGLPNPGLRLRYESDQLLFECLTTCTCLHNGQPQSSGELKLADLLKVGECEFQVVHPPLLVTLQGLNEPHRGQVWLLDPLQKSLIGRPGRRVNQVSLDDPTVSRMHGHIRAQGEEFFLEVESASTPTRLNGELIAPGQPQLLRDGDLLRLGNSLLGFYQPRVRLDSESPARVLRIYSLGSFEVHLAAVRFLGSQWKTHLGRFLMAYLAQEWPAPVAVERLLDIFWPEMDPDRARNNLRSTLTNLRSLLQVPPRGKLFERTTNTVQFDPQLIIWHDLSEIKRHLKQAHDSGGQEKVLLLSRALELYRGKYLEDCYLDFAVTTRESLELQLVQAACVLMEHHAALSEFSRVLDFGQQALVLDGSCQEAYLSMMRACRGLNRPEEAVRLYETCKRQLRRELDIDPSLEIEREYQMARLSLS